jgi:hypothetical protein
LAKSPLRPPLKVSTVTGAVGCDKEKPLVQSTYWCYRFLGPNQGIVCAESAFTKHPQSGLPEPRSGKEALRTHAMVPDARTQVYQDVDVQPATA